MECGISPLEVDKMSLYELSSTMVALAKRRKPVVTVSDEEWEHGEEVMRQLAARDPSIRLN